MQTHVRELGNHSLLARGLPQSSRVGSSQAHQGGLVVSLNLSSVFSTHPSLLLPGPQTLLLTLPLPPLSLSLSLFLRTFPVCVDSPPSPLSRSHCRYPSATHSPHRPRGKLLRAIRGRRKMPQESHVIRICTKQGSCVSSIFQSLRNVQNVQCSEDFREVSLGVCMNMRTVTSLGKMQNPKSAPNL